MYRRICFICVNWVLWLTQVLWGSCRERVKGLELRNVGDSAVFGLKGFWLFGASAWVKGLGFCFSVLALGLWAHDAT